MAVVTITKDNFAAEIGASERPVLVDFWASWCGPCQRMSPLVDEIAEEHPEVKVGKINIDEQPEAAMTYRVMSIPTLILFKDGVELERIVGARGKASFQQMLDKHTA